MEQFVGIMRNVGVSRTWAALAVLLVTLVFVMFIGMRYTGPEMVLLFGNLDTSSSQRIQIELSKQEAEFDVRNNGADIFVGRDQVSKLRVALAELGLSGAIVGWEIFDKDGTLGTSSFQQNVNKLRAMEGELARTISSIKGVSGARVHIVLPQRDLFSKTEQNPSASVVLKMGSVQRLEAPQVLAIQHLLSSAVPKLKVSDITVLDDQGALLARGGKQDENSLSSNIDEMRIKEADRLRSRLETLLTRVLGFGKARVEVQVEMNMEKSEVNREVYDPEGSALRSRENIEEVAAIRNGADTTVTVANNVPNAEQSGQATGGNSENSQKNEERNNYEISRTVTNTTIQPGEIKRITVAVLVDQTTVKDAEGKDTIQARSPEELAKLKELVSSAIGFSEARKDVVTITELPFATLPGSLEIPEIKYLGFFTTTDLKRFMELMILAVVGLLVVFLVVRPLVMRIFETPASTLSAQMGKGMIRLPDGRMVYIDPESGEQQEVPVPVTRQLAPGEGFAGEDKKELEDILNIDDVEGRVKASAIKKIGEIIDKNPEEAVGVLRSWLYQDTY